MEAMLFEGVPAVGDGVATVDRSRPGLGLQLREDAAGSLQI